MTRYLLLKLTPLLALIWLPGCALSPDSIWADDGLPELDRAIAELCNREGTGLGGLRLHRTSAHLDRFRVSTDYVNFSAQGSSRSTSHSVISAMEYSRARLEVRNLIPDDGFSTIYIWCHDRRVCWHDEASGIPRSDGMLNTLYCETDNENALYEAFLNLQAYYQSGLGVDSASFAQGFATPQRPVAGGSYPLTIVVQYSGNTMRVRSRMRRGSLREEDVLLDSALIRNEIEQYFGTVETTYRDLYGPAGTEISSVQVLSPREITNEYLGFLYYVDIGQSYVVGETDAGVRRCSTPVTISRAHSTRDTADAELFDIFETMVFGQPTTRHFNHTCGVEGANGDIEGLASDINDLLRTWVRSDYR